MVKQSLNTNDCFAVRSSTKQEVTKQALELVSRLGKGEQVEQELRNIIRKIASM